MNSLTQHPSAREDGARQGGQIDCLQEAERLQLPKSVPQGWGQDALGHPETEARLGRLVRALESEVIPRLLRAHRAAEAPKAEPHDVVPTEAEVRAFAQLVLARDDRPASELIESLRGRGASVEGLFLHLLAPAARHLGALWEQDLCDFTEVTVGVGRMQQLMRELSPGVRHRGRAPAAPACRILLAPAPGEQHTFGLSMVAEFFRRAGWEVVGGMAEADADPVDMVREMWFDVVGISVGNEARLDWLGTGIAALRRSSLNQGIGVMVGGPFFRDHPEQVALVGADATAVDGRHAPMLAESLLDLRTFKT